jgi:iodotyrosine deiodinase
MPPPTTIPLNFHEYSPSEMQQRADEFYDEMKRRRSVRAFSERPVPREIIETCLRTAVTAPNGANMQPWHFVVVSDPEVKYQIRIASEEVECQFYMQKAPQEWLDALEPLGTNFSKPFLDQAPYLIAIFAQSHGIAADGSKVSHYYVQESVGIATGFLIAALHHAGLACLTYTPSPMRFLNQILERPSNEKPFLILVVGYPAEGASVPEIAKKSLDEIVTVF